MAIAWDALESRISEYLDKGKDDKTRTYEVTALNIENMYIDAVRFQGLDPYGNNVVSLNKFALAASLRAGFKSAVDVPIPSGPSIKPPDINIPKIDLGALKMPNLNIPNIDVPRLGLPEMPTVNTPNLSLPNLPSGNVPNVNLPNINVPKANLPKQPETSVPEVPSFDLPPVPGMPPLPEAPKAPEFKFNPISINFSDFIPKGLNTLGLSGLLLTWSGAQLSTIVPPPGSVSVINNTVVSTGTIPTMNVGTDPKNKLAKELVNGFKEHVKTISGMTTALVYTGTTLVPTQFPWTGIV